MSRLIDADKLFDEVETYKDEVCDEPQVAHHVLNLICKAPTVDRWHYPLRGEIPKENGKYFCKVISLVTQHSEGWYDVVLFGSRGWVLGSYTQVVAWQYVIPPKENEK